MGRNTLIVNLSKNADVVKKIVDQIPHEGKKYSFIDFSGGKFEFKGISCFSARQFDYDNQIEKASINAYVHLVGELSLQKGNDGRNIRGFQINNLPVYWLTSFAEKHPLTHWVFAYFFFKGFVDAKPDFFNAYEEVRIIIPVPDEIFNRHIENNWDWLSEKVSIVYGIEPIRYALFKSCYKKFRFYLKYILTYLWKGFISTRANKDGFPDYMLLSLGHSKTETFLQKCIKDFLQKNGQLLHLHMQDVLCSSYKSRPRFILKSYPNPCKVLILLIRIFQNERLAKRAHRLAVDQKDFFLSMVYAEIYKTLQDIPLYFNHLWLINIFYCIKSPLKVFYEDEMYRTGRIISSAANMAGNKNLQTIAYQHGNISESHAVYRFCDAEIRNSHATKKDSVPLPDLFLVWGEYFKTQFLEWFSFEPKRVIVTGNLWYIQIQKQYPLKSSIHRSIKHILWCTTSFDFAKSEFEIIQRKVQENDLLLTIRMHPNFNIKNDLRQIIPRSLYVSIVWDTARSIYDSINNSDLVVCSGHSTVFIDCIVCKKPVIRLYNFSIMSDTLNGADVYVKSANTPDDFSEALSTFNTGHDFSQSSKYLYVENDEVWRNVIKPQKAISNKTII